MPAGGRYSYAIQHSGPAPDTRGLVMSNPAAIVRLFEAIARSGLLSRDRLRSVLDPAPDADDPDAAQLLADRLVDAGLLTPFQARQLLLGKTRGFFLAEKFKVLDLLGSGGMGQVYLCEHLVLQRLVAVKVLHAGPARPEPGGDAAAVERFVREARAVAALDHPNIVRVYDMERAGATPFLVMEYVDGTNLHEIVSRTGPLASSRAAHYVSQAAAGLQHAHDHGLVHRDVKPGNLLLDRSGVVKLLDLGLARFHRDTGRSDEVTARYHEQHAVGGTADYMAPEQGIDSATVDIRSDIYSLGATFYFLLTGRAPFAGEPLAQKMLGHQVREPVAIPSIRADVPPGVSDVVARMMAKKPGDRFATPVEVIGALAPWTREPARAPSADEMPRTPPAAYRLGLTGTLPPAAGITDPLFTADPAEVGADTPRAADDRTDAPRRPGWVPEPTASLPPGMGPPAKRDNGASGPRASRSRRSVTLAALAASFVILLGVGLAWRAGTGHWRPFGSAGPDTPAGQPKADGAGAGAPAAVLAGGGSTFIQRAMDRWAVVYERETGVRVKYDGIGSGRGVESMIGRKLDFGCTDAPLTDAQLATARAASGDVLHIPLALGAVVATYNLPDVAGPLRFTGPVLADIFLGKIRKWNHRSIATSNPGVRLPDLDIVVVHRADSSGTTFIWTEYLGKVSADWRTKVGPAATKVNWPLGEEGDKNDGVARAVSRRVGAIGYVELAFALERNLNVSLVQNQTGRYVEASLESVAAAADAALQTIPPDLRYTFTDAPGADSYPIAGTTWAVLYAKQTGRTGRELLRFVRWATHEGQVHLRELQYAPLPPRLVERLDEALAAIPEVL